MSLQYPFLTATLGLFGGICLAGVGLAGWQFLSYSSYEKKLKDVLSDREQILNSAIAPTEENLERAKKNYDNIVAREQELYEILKGNKTTVESTAPEFTKKSKAKVFPEEDNQQPADLVNKLRESANRLSALFKNPKVRIYRIGGGRNSDFGFGFKRYVSATDGTTPRNRLRDIALEKTLIEYFVNHLVKAQSEDGSPLILQAVMREPVEIPRERSSATSNINSDEYIPTQVEVVRGKGIVDSYYFRFTFTARTGLVRRWINNMDADGYPLFLRGIAVAPAKPEVLAPEETAIPGVASDGSAPPPPPPPPVAPLSGFAGFGEVPPPPLPVPDTATPNAPAAPGKTGSKDAQIILEATPSEFTVSFEYVLPASETAGKPSNN